MELENLPEEMKGNYYWSNTTDTPIFTEPWL